ncbi:hypothetical protein [Pseudoalteromonas phage J2-1_QLiu-2017]|nr:hypothetical protein [Pseudoalteromonas phage J2-1_QLiu-2017]
MTQEVQKPQLSAAILDLYKGSRLFNQAANGGLSKERLENQLNTVKEEAKELLISHQEKNRLELVDAIIDCLYTGSELVMIIDGNEDLLEDTPKFYEEDLENSEATLFACLGALAAGNYYSFLCYAEDLAATIEGYDMAGAVKHISDSNDSKFVPISWLEENDLTIKEMELTILREGRYTEVFSKKVDYKGVPSVVFMAKFDKQENTRYEQGKVVKPKGYFIEPNLALFIQ